MNCSLSNLFDKASKRNDTLLELTSKKCSRMKHNSIDLTKMKYDDELNHIYYDSICMGKKLLTTKQHLKYGNNKRSR